MTDREAVVLCIDTLQKVMLLLADPCDCDDQNPCDRCYAFNLAEDAMTKLME